MMDETELLTIRRARAWNEVDRLQREIDACEHTFVEETAYPASCELDLGESIGSTVVWVLEQRRTCPKCGLAQTRKKFEPNDAWEEWDDSESQD